MAPSPSDCANPLARRISLYFVPEDSLVACLAPGRLTSLASCILHLDLVSSGDVCLPIRELSLTSDLALHHTNFCLCLYPLRFTLALYLLLHFLSASLGVQRSWLLSLPPAKLISTSPQAPFPPLLLPTEPFNIPPPQPQLPVHSLGTISKNSPPAQIPVIASSKILAPPSFPLPQIELPSPASAETHYGFATAPLCRRKGQ